MTPLSPPSAPATHHAPRPPQFPERPPRSVAASLVRTQRISRRNEPGDDMTRNDETQTIRLVPTEPAANARRGIRIPAIVDKPRAPRAPVMIDLGEAEPKA